MNTVIATDKGSGNPDAAELIAQILGQNHGRVCITNSFQAEDMVVLHLLQKHLREVSVLFLDTGYHFAATYAFRDRMTAAWDLNLINVLPQQTVPEQESRFGILYQSDPGQCCQLRKVEPLMRVLENYDVWFTGLRRDQSPTRKTLSEVEHHVLPSGKAILKVSPLAAWDWQRLWQYTVEHRIEYLPLYDQGYRSVGCQPCTAIPAEGADPRSGRWGGTKLECGIHTFSQRSDQ